MPHGLSHGSPHGSGAEINHNGSTQSYQSAAAQMSHDAAPDRAAVAAATARLARRRAVAQETASPGQDTNLSPGDVRRGRLLSLRDSQLTYVNSFAAFNMSVAMDRRLQCKLRAVKDLMRINTVFVTCTI